MSFNRLFVQVTKEFVKNLFVIGPSEKIGCTVPGGGRPSFMLNAVANIPKGNAPIPNDIWKPPSPNPKPWNPCREQNNGRGEKGTNNLKPISKYFTEVQMFPLTGFLKAEGVSCSLATFSLPLLLNTSQVLMGKVFYTVANLPQAPKSLRR